VTKKTAKNPFNPKVSPTPSTVNLDDKNAITPLRQIVKKQSKLEDLIKIHGKQCVGFANSSRSRSPNIKSSKMLNSFWWNLLQSHALSALYLQATLQQQQSGNHSTIADQ